MARKAGSGYQDIRKIENKAIAKADKESRKRYPINIPAETGHNMKNDNNNTGGWTYKMINGRWHLVRIVRNN